MQRILAGDVDVLNSYFEQPEYLKNQNLDYYYESHESRLRCDKEQFYRELDYALGKTGLGFNKIRDLVKGEYDALCDEECNDPDFLTIESEVPMELVDYIDQIKIVGRLREVQVLEGFRRISPDESALAPLSRKPKDWLPGNELYGEGIFIKLREDQILAWEKKNAHRYKSLISRAKNNFFANGKVDDGNVRYILLHTISHLLIRELTLQCGYTSAAIKEKIYSSESNEKPMCGLLIYTASSDSDGSLGGLARQGISEKIRDIFMSMLEGASWCSNDPICIDSKNQGYASLNYAACHACSLLPETSCECFNILLDRGALIGTTSDPSLGYFSAIVQ